MALDAHCEMIMEEFRGKRTACLRLEEKIIRTLRETLAENHILVTAVEGRVKEEKSLAGKLELKGYKYKSLSDITDIIGCRVITFYSNEVDKIAALVEQLFEIDWENSVDKRKLYEADQFGYMSLHYICRMPRSRYTDPECPEINDMRFEIQMRTTLQHVWATAYHDTGYKSDIEVPKEYLRALSRLAGVLEIADEEFNNILTSLEEYRRNVRAVVKSGKYEELALNGDTFRNYMAIGPFASLNEKIAGINRAEIQEANAGPYLEVFVKLFDFKTLADIENLKKEFGDDAYRLAARQIAGTDLDILSSNVGVQNLCIVKLLKEGHGITELKELFDILFGPRDRNLLTAKRTLKLARELNIAQDGKDE